MSIETFLKIGFMIACKHIFKIFIEQRKNYFTYLRTLKLGLLTQTYNPSYLGG